MPVQSETLPSDNFAGIAERIFTEKIGNILIGGAPVTPEIRDVLREEAKYIAKSNFFEIFSATIINESMTSLLQADNDKASEFGKGLYYWNKVLTKMTTTLSK